MPFQISGQSMASSYYNKEFILVDRLSYIIGSPERGDVIVFRPGVDKDKKYFLKRIIGMPGDNVKIESGEVYVKTPQSSEYVKLDETYLNTENKGFTYVGSSSTTKEYRLGKDQYYVMWDNRNHSTDSRQCFFSCAIEWSKNFVKQSDMTGRVFLDIWFFNFSDFSFIQPDLWVDTTPKFFNSPSGYTYPEL